MPLKKVGCFPHTNVFVQSVQKKNHKMNYTKKEFNIANEWYLKNKNRSDFIPERYSFIEGTRYTEPHQRFKVFKQIIKTPFRITLVVCGTLLAICGVEDWGWLIFLALLFES